MSRAYFSFKTNLPDWSKDIATPNVDYFAFHKDDLTISVGCCGWSEFGVTNGIYEGRFTDLEMAIEANDGETIQEWEPMTEENFKLLEGAEMYEIGIYIPEVEYSNPIKGKELSLEIEFGELSWKFKMSDMPIEEIGDACANLPLIEIDAEVRSDRRAV
ncbi:MAG: hypothetical protein K6E64_03745 [Lachnospiraceae bacterium]|nr:hypothetical protein [Lachnospiraceae bacterium]